MIMVTVALLCTSYQETKPAAEDAQKEKLRPATLENRLLSQVSSGGDDDDDANV